MTGKPDRPAAAARHVAVYVPTLAGGGAEQSMLRLAGALAERGHAVDLLLNRRAGAYAGRVPAGVRVVELGRYSKWRARLDVLRAEPADVDVIARPVLLARTPIMSLRYLQGLADYMRTARPGVVISALFYANLLAIWGRRLARVDTLAIVTEHNNLSRRIAAGQQRRSERSRWVHLPALLARVYRRADAIVTVSDGVGDDLAAITGLARDTITTIHNPVVFPGLGARAAEAVDHPWFDADAPPVILAAGRLEPQKGFAVLLEAFARLRRQRMVRLMILGEGSLRECLRRQADELGVGDDVCLHGWADNPYACMRRARLFVLSSIWEGLGNVLIEAMACGCPVVATDCPSGPREILDGGRYGRLVPPNDAAALAEAMAATLDGPADNALLRRRAQDFSIANSAERYLALIERLATGSPAATRR